MHADGGGETSASERLLSGRRPGTPNGTTTLSPRETQVLELRAAGKSWNAIADVTLLDKATIRDYHARALAKLERRAEQLGTSA